MAIRVELHKEAVTEALTKSLDSAKRGKNTTKNPKFTILYEQQIHELQTALNTLQEIK